MDIRPLTINYSAECLEILNATFSTPWKELETIFNTPSNRIWGAFIKSQLVGFVVLSQILDEGEILMCAVKPPYQRQGIAHSLLTHTLGELRNINTVFLEVDITNLPAQKLYQKMGFNSMGHRKNYYLQPDGSYHDAVIMRLNFNN